ncbi:hypothetical protein GJW-30_1_01930 [Variibacter gotjawalensis]|uniref:DUF4365 domain-containing protein n=1 Tax=Variibacter gotjawalensis TaxID=1333996 RepID=A0A0S3PTU4_9BRAD|nr:DUF4365 domain-containing protein [Variibacter gotjawalensis]NIK49714.1 hypothetical protein [Variibacter gotjawalensis]RZS45724.1 uncharacterized protein DUF4365 [Variibacter gotjawalensis]BAT59397.1 hypothetical protein GJW-30_1_01930 [Variibacter gotjawalensis]
MDLPKIGTTYPQERVGIAAVQAYAATSGQIWRETDTGDVGIDGQLEYVNDGSFATGRTIAVQVKSGPSFFKHDANDAFKFYPEEKHRRYWEGFPLPVVLVIHDPRSGKSYWTDARQELRSPSKAGHAYISIPKANLLQETPPQVLFENAGVTDQPFIDDLTEVMLALLTIKSGEQSFPLSYFDLYVQGLTSICRSIYYGMDVVMNAVEFNLVAAKAEYDMGMGGKEQDFVFGFVKFLLAQNLAQVDYADCMIDWIDRQMQPTFVAPLTSRGRELVALINREEKRLLESGALADEGGMHVAQEGFFEMLHASYYRRQPRIRQFQEIMGGKET